MNFIIRYFLCAALIGTISSCGDEDSPRIERPTGVWAYRSVLDKRPRMLTLALNKECHVAYDLGRCAPYKVWKGGVLMEGAPYTQKKNVQPTTWGTAYVQDSLLGESWFVKSDGKDILAKITNNGYAFKKNQIYLKYTLVLSSGDSIQVEERPEFVQSTKKMIGLERWFKTSKVPSGASVHIRFGEDTLKLNPNAVTVQTDYFEMLPEQQLPELENAYDHRGLYWMEASDCFTCHEVEEKAIAPSFREIAKRYKSDSEIRRQLLTKIQLGGSGSWGSTAMNAHPQLSDKEIHTMLSYIFTLKPKSIENEYEVPMADEPTVANKDLKPGYGAPLNGVHPSYDLTTLHKENFKPKVGGLAFLPDGRLLLTTWDTEGGVYVLDGVQTGDTTKITKKRIASGLHEPLGIEVVNGAIYVLQKHELTQLIDHDGDEIIDEYKAICNSWEVTHDFHEFAFGLVYEKGHFYIALSMAMRLTSGQKQKEDRGRVLKISPDGGYESLNYGLRTPNGIGKGVDDEIFVTDNQGQWLPANKLIHVKEGEYHGMAWGLSDSLSAPPKMTPPTIWLPQDEIGNSPSEPILLKDGPYQNQMLHGDVSNGGLKRDFIEKINGNYQGCVFRFTQGLEAGVNRVTYGPDGALYLGEVGMKGGWGWKDRTSGLQRMKYNGHPTFEMLAIRAKSDGFEIEFTQPILHPETLNVSDFFIQQWWYLPTADYGGPKMDLERLRPIKLVVSENGKKIYLKIPGLKKEHLVYFRIPDTIRSTKGESLWSNESWYTLNTIPAQ